MNADIPGPSQFAGDALLDEMRHRQRPLVFLLSGPSGVGKDSVAAALKGAPEEGGLDHIRVIVTATTRERREGEEHLVDYEFMSRDDYLQRLTEGYFLENAAVYGSDKLYGVPRHRVIGALNEGDNALIKIDVQGAATLKQLLPQSVTIFLAPESVDALRDRLERRNTDDPVAVSRRLRTAISELDRSVGFDYIVVNESGKLPETVRRIRAIITAERLKNSMMLTPRL